MHYVIFILIFFVFAKAETFDEIVSRIDNNPYILSNKSLVESYEGEIIKAKSFSNPDGYIQFGRLVGGNSSATITEFYISQPLKLYNQRRYNIESAVSEKLYQSLQFDSFKRKYLSVIYQSFYEALYNKELLKIAENEANLSKEIFNFTEKVYKLGEASKLDFLKAQREYQLSISKLNQQKLLYLESLKSLSSLVGYEIKDVEGDFYHVRDIKTIDFLSLPEIKSFDEKIKSLQALEKYYKALSYPQISVGVIAKEYSNDKYESGLVVNFTLPVFYRNLGEIVSVKNQKASYTSLKDYTVNSLKIKYSSILESYKSDLDLISQLNESIETAKNELNLAEKSYKLKTISLFEFFNIKALYFETLKYKLEIYKHLHQLYSKYLEIGGSLWKMYFY